MLFFPSPAGRAVPGPPGDKFMPRHTVAAVAATCPGLVPWPPPWTSPAAGCGTTSPRRPRPPPEAGGGAALRRTSGPPSGSRRGLALDILIAEDDPVSRRVLEAALARWGYR